ncbi:XRE family transcriptional regulator [Pluralibacter gergoviae]|uniref:XRE family transcriptional regulator n=1 Tax=Pluralibacter gergoviae TaxID=61647 RepID=UPI0006BF95B2|nr:S24 family peptidase [Pluralibacter gergoviae]KOQ95792.1 hypothetical protein ABW48_16255 [Pluralibacter gergoviae]
MFCNGEMNVGEKIRLLRKSKKLTLTELALLVESDVGNLSRLERGLQGYSDQLLRKISSALEVPVSELFSDGSTGHVDSIVTAGKSKTSETFRVDVLDLTVSAGPGTYMLSDSVEVLTAIEFTNEHARSLFGSRRSKDIKVMTVDGDSMFPTIKSGDRLFFDVSVREFTTDGVYAFVFGKTFHVKRLQMQGLSLSVLSDNPAYKDWSITEDNHDQLYVIGKALLHESIQYGKL